MSLGKVLGVGILLYLVLNFVFMLIYVGVGGYASGASIGQFFTDMSHDTFGFISALLSPGGGKMWTSQNPATGFKDPISVIGALLMDFDANNKDTIIDFVAILWVIAPGLIAALVAGIKMAEDNSKSAFFGIFLAILILTAVPMIFGLTGQITTLSTHAITTNLVPDMYYQLTGNMAYIAPILNGAFMGIIYGGIAAASASNL